MIAFLEGTVHSIGSDRLVLRVGGIGYEVYYVDVAPLVGQPLSVWIVDYIREDRRELYGFVDEGMRELFERMIEISGIGPRMAQKILRAASREQLQQHIQGGNVSFLTQVPGVGKKTAQKIILELQGVLVAQEPELQADQETVDVLMSLGYGRSDAQAVAAELSDGTMEERVKEALQRLGA